MPDKFDRAISDWQTAISVKDEGGRKRTEEEIGKILHNALIFRRRGSGDWVGGN